MINAFNYHDIGMRSTWSHTKQDFDAILTFYSDGIVKPELLTDIDVWDEKCHVLLTFDDGKKSNLYVADKLEEHGWKGHFFIPTEIFDCNNSKHLNKKEIRALQKRGHLIGSHSHTHTDFRCLSYKQMLYEWQTSRDILEDTLGNAVKTAAIPKGFYSSEVTFSACTAGYDFLFTSVPTLFPWRLFYGCSDITCLGRVSPKGTTSLSYINNLIKFRNYWKEIIMYNVKNILKHILASLP